MIKLSHPNIVKLYDLIVDTSYNNIYFVFDYFPKGDFAKFLDNKPLKEKYCKKYAKQLADGLRYLLDNNIIHRDLKPQNILVTNELDIKITDFGFARKFDNGVLFNTLCGSPMYMAPEIINKQDLIREKSFSDSEKLLNFLIERWLKIEFSNKKSESLSAN